MNYSETQPRAPHIIGAAFESYVREALFLRRDYELLERSPAFTANPAQFALSALNPDFKFRDRRTGKQFYVEVKFRRRYFDCNEITWTYPEQLERYHSFNR